MLFGGVTRPCFEGSRECRRVWGVNIILTHVSMVVYSMVGQSGFPVNQPVFGTAINDFFSPLLG